MKPFVKHIQFLFVVIALAFSGGAFAESVNKKAPEIRLADAKGKIVKLSDFKGQVVMVNFWASWCVPCRTEMPLIEALYKKYKKIGFTVLGVNMDEDPNNGKKMLKEIPVSFPVVYGGAGDANIDKYNVQAMPSTYMVDRKGNIREIHRGYKKGEEKEYEEYIRKLLRG